MKRIVCVAVCLLLVLSCFSGCSKADNDSGKIKIVATVFPPYDFARIIAGDRAEVTMLIRPGSESHSFEPTPEDMILSEESDMFLYIGGESESWAERLIESSENTNRKNVKLIDCVTLLEAGSGEEHHHHSEEHNHSHEHDEHIWTSPTNAINMCETIYNTLCSVDPQGKEYYTENFENYKAELINLDNEFKSISQNKGKDTLIFGDRFPFLYLTNEYGINYKAAFPGCSEETEPDINTLVSLIEYIKENNINTVFYTEFSSKKIADMLCRETGAQMKLLHSCHNVTAKEFKEKATYLSLMKNNAENIKTALN